MSTITSAPPPMVNKVRMSMTFAGKKLRSCNYVLVNSVSFDPPVLSDHSQIVGVLAARLPHPHTGSRQVCRCWRQLNLDELKNDIQ